MMEMTCIVCPNGCELTVDKNGETINVSGNRCPRGIKFAETELIKPMRTICSTVKTVFPDTPVLPVRTSSEIPKDQIFAVMKEINRLVLKERIQCGDVVIHNVLNLGVDIIATSNQLQEEDQQENLWKSL
ncbi:MAG: DUF1667 domain-containing protein [Erysipelotrichia bacterium]|nr:DUF1667 domain-containing protein [Erysipelotrichia bacterium]